MRTVAGRDFDLLIVGAGVIGTTMAGLAVARKLAAPGRVAVIAQGSPAATPALAAFATPDVEWDLRVFALSRASQRLLGISGAWPTLPSHKRHAYERMCVWDATGVARGAGSLSFDCAQIGEPNLGFIVEGRALQEHSARAARTAGVVFIDAALEAIDIDAEGVLVRLADGRHLGGQLLIAADGTESPTRQLLGIDTAGHAYHQEALVAHVRTSLPHANTAWQKFLPTGPLAFLPLPDGRSSIVWSLTRPDALRLRALDAEAFASELTRASGGVLGSCELTTRVASFPLKLQYALDYVRPRAVLLGDAAHVVHPLAGQGLNLGLLDCASLAEVLGRAGSAGYFGEHALLRRYERWRRSENLLAAGALDGVERLFASRNVLLSRARATGLSVLGRLPFVKREMVGRALGLRGDVPAFLLQTERH